MRAPVFVAALLWAGLATQAVGQDAQSKGAVGLKAGASEVAPIAAKSDASCAGGMASGYPCENVDLISVMPRSAFQAGQYRLNDLWGWEDPDTGRRYVLQGMEDGTAFVDITDPADPWLVGKLPRTTGSRASVWRDLKVYDNHAFIVADGAGAHGMQVFNLKELDPVVRGQVATFTELTRYEGFGSSHNLVINEASGFAFAVGSSRGVCDQSLHMIDIRDPRRPLFAGCFLDQRLSRGYTHDAQCVIYEGPDARYRGREICFAANEAAVSIADVTNKDLPVALGAATYPASAYVHQGWLSEDHRYFYQNDELDERSGGTNTTTFIWDVADLEDPQLVGEFQPGTNSIDHNLYVADGLVYAANYTSGLQIMDIVDPTDPVKVGYFDTTPNNSAVSFDGTWTVYPWFSDGTIAVSSRSEGLFLLRVAGILVSRIETFSAGSEEGMVQFDWTMRRQDDIDRFEIELQEEDGTFVFLAKISGGGTANDRREYQIVSDDLPLGRSRVRLVGVSSLGLRRTLAEEDVYVVPGSHLLADVFPNPTAGSSTLSLMVSESQEIAVEAYDLSGRRVAVVHRGWVESDSELLLDIPAGEWSGGQYLIQVTGRTFSATRSVTVNN